MMTRWIAVVAVLGLAGPAWGGAFTNVGWSTKPDGEGQVCDLGRFGACYYNFTSATDSPVLAGAATCSQVFTRVLEITTDIQIDIQACDPAESVSCTDLINGTDITASGTGPEGGVANGIKVNVDTCTTCEGEVEVVCGRGR